MTRRLLTTIVLCLGSVVLGSTSSFAAGEPLPGGFYDDGMGGGFPDPGMPPGFAALFVIVAIGGIGMTIWRVSLARQMAKSSGMDPDQATAVTLLSDDGLDATYLASNLRNAPAGEPSPARSAQERLRELEQLRGEGLITTGEYEARRRAIVDSI